MKSLLRKDVENFKDELIEIRKYFHQHPELGLEEFKTSKKIYELLTSWGVEAEYLSETGVVGIIKGDNPGKTIALRADIDALPIEEMTGLEFSSKHKHKMHACGHDGHITICLGAAKILSKYKEKLNGNVKFIFQPAEEGPGGAEMLIEKGVLKNPDVDAILGLHIWPELPKNSIGITGGPIMAAADRFDIEVIGKGGHGAIPQLSVDPIYAASQLVTTLQSIVSRETSPLDSIVLSNCTFHGGDAFNIIPNNVKISGTTRYHNPDFSETLPKRMEEIVKGVCSTMRCDYEFKYSHWYPVTLNDKDFSKFFKDSAKDVLGDDNVVEIEKPSMGAEDFSFFLEKTPGTYFFLGTRDEENGLDKPIHHPEYYFSEDILPTGVELFCNAVLNYLS